MIVYVGSELVTSEPVDLVFFNAVKDHFITERNAVGRASVGALAANLAKIFDPNVHRLIGNQREVGEDRVGHMNTRAEFFVDHEPISAQLTDTSGDSCRLGSYDAAQRRIT